MIIANLDTEILLEIETDVEYIAEIGEVKSFRQEGSMETVECGCAEGNASDAIKQIASRAKDRFPSDIQAVVVYQPRLSTDKKSQADLEVVTLTTPGVEDGVNEFLMRAIQRRKWDQFVSLTVADAEQFIELAELGDAFAVAAILEGECVVGAKYVEKLRSKLISAKKPRSTVPLQNLLESTLQWRDGEVERLAHEIAEHVYWLYSATTIKTFMEDSGKMDYPDIAKLASPQNPIRSLEPKAAKVLRRVVRLRRKVHANPSDAAALASMIRLWQDVDNYRAMLQHIGSN
ncbi:MAG TPA: hypothetical protein PL033_00955 [Candidatus Brocadiia bacterium]|nr:hypothetical protein [Candidatus Brocadiia bacterium]